MEIDYKKPLKDLEKLIQKVSEKPIYFSVFVLAGLIISLSIITEYDKYILFGFTALFYSVVAISVRLFYKDMRDYVYGKTPASPKDKNTNGQNNKKIWPFKYLLFEWFNIFYHIIQLLITTSWIYFIFRYVVFIFR